MKIKNLIVIFVVIVFSQMAYAQNAEEIENLLSYLPSTPERGNYVSISYENYEEIRKMSEKVDFYKYIKVLTYRFGELPSYMMNNVASIIAANCSLDSSRTLMKHEMKDLSKDLIFPKEWTEEKRENARNTFLQGQKVSIDKTSSFQIIKLRNIAEMKRRALKEGFLHKEEISFLDLNVYRFSCIADTNSNPKGYFCVFQDDSLLLSNKIPYLLQMVKTVKGENRSFIDDQEYQEIKSFLPGAGPRWELYTFMFNSKRLLDKYSEQIKEGGDKVKIEKSIERTNWRIKTQPHYLLDRYEIGKKIHRIRDYYFESEGAAIKGKPDIERVWKEGKIKVEGNRITVEIPHNKKSLELVREEQQKLAKQLKGFRDTASKRMGNK